MAEQRGRSVNHLNYAVKSGSGETTKRLMAKDDVEDYSNRNDHRASILRRCTRYIASFFKCCNVFGKKEDVGISSNTIDTPQDISTPCGSSGKLKGATQLGDVSTFNNGNGFGRGITRNVLRKKEDVGISYGKGSRHDTSSSSRGKYAGEILGDVSTFNNDDEFGRGINKLHLFSVRPFEPVHDPVKESPCHGGGTGSIATGAVVKVAGEGTSKQVTSTSGNGPDPSPPRHFQPEWEITSDDRYNNPSTCRDMLLQLSTPAERAFQRGFSHEEALHRSFAELGMAVSTVADLLHRDEDLFESHKKLKKIYEKLKERHKERNAHVISLEHKKKVLEARLAKCNEQLRLDASLKRSMDTTISEQKQRISFLESEKQKAVKELLPTVVSRLLRSEEYQRSHAHVQSLSFTAGYIAGLKVDRSPERYEELVADATDLNLDVVRTSQPTFKDLFSTSYSYVTHVSASYPSTIGELLNIHPQYAEPNGPPVK